MINCPNCDKQIADDSAHCGYCGHQLEEKNKKKTMFGMAALGGDELKKAVEQAKEAKKEQDESSHGDGQGKKGGGLRIPKPGQGAGKEEGTGKEGAEKSGLSLPKPGQKKEESADAGSSEAEPAEASSTDEEQEGLAKTERMDVSEAKAFIDSADEPASSASTDEEPPEVDDPGAPTEPTFTEPVGPGPSQVSQAGAQTGPFGPGAKEAEQGKQPVQVDRAGSMPAGGPAGSTPGAQEGGFGQKQFDTTPPGQGPAQSQNQSQNQLQSQEQGKGKSKKGIIIGIVIATMVLGGGCTIALAYWAYTAFF